MKRPAAPDAKSSPVRVWLPLALALVAYLAGAFAVMPFVPDDTYISYRYAENLAEGHGLTFNRGAAPVEGYSNFLWILVVAATHALGLSVTQLIPLLSLLCGSIAIVLLWRLLIRRDVPPLYMLLPLLLFATSGPFVIYSVSGLESSLFTLLLIAALLSFDSIVARGRRRDYIALAIVGVLVALCRPEGGLVFPFLLAALWVVRGRKDGVDKRSTTASLIAVAVFAGLFGIYTLWRVTYFGESLPTPFLSKALANAWRTNLSLYFVRQGFSFAPMGYYYVALGLACWAGLRARRLDEPGALVDRAAFGLALAYAALYFNFIDWMPGMRYHAALVPLFLLGSVHLQGVLLQRPQADTLFRRSFVVVSVTAMLLSFSILMQLRLMTQRLEEGNQQCLVQLGNWLKQHAPPNALLAMSDVGAVPYYSGLRTMDIEPRSLTDLHIAKNGITPEYFFSRNPDVVVLVSRGILSPKMYPEHFVIARTPLFSQRYRFIGSTRYAWFQDRSFWVFFPKTSPLLSDEVAAAFPTGLGSMRRVER